ncbi:hypothetical protein C6990_05390 [Nitrosopumilus sp. b3]|uniref:Eco57I restriction-modification methylase domain-containing protein n=1 Tax=Nitrosopumilus sp. b3 TaxID=2109909 RepID=UPI0015F52F57|nr:N-6 DNA methylase [Nitrosopumilus sp. b3]KAF6247115.1 hypothetical protein C6990_05390 [Nitrosopumilus sp. b3]
MTTANDLFNPKTIRRLCSDVKISTKQKKAASEWLKLLESGQLEKEKQNYFKFGLIVLKDLLGYPVKEDMGYEEGNVEFTFSNNEGKKIVCFEAKGTKTKDLFAPQYRDKKEHSTPVKQTWDYMGILNLDYGIATNYEQFVLIDKGKGTSKFHSFHFKDIKKDEEKLREFIAIFSKSSIIDNKFVTTLYDQSVIEEKEFTKQFYRLFHETRLMLIKEFQSNGEIQRDEAIHYAQLFLNRMVFIFFAEDTGKVPQRLIRDQILKVLDAVPVSEHSKYAYDTIFSLFESLDKGSNTPVQIFGFNGGLFQDKIPPRFYVKDLTPSGFFKKEYQNSELKKKVKLDEFAEKVIKKYQNRINPIITNLLYMSSFDFNTELNVNILGHIFEQSLTDLEELQETKISKRKIEGIFYTPEYVTDFICRNAIIRHLSKNNASNIEDLIKEYSEDIGQLEEKFKGIKILDPACGSGAFLLKAVDILLEIHKQIQTYKEFKGQYSISMKGKKDKKISEQFTLSKWNEESEAKKIIESNIFGVDVNQESTEITKLSLFLKIATGNRKLIDLSKNIRVGNSLIDDKKVDSKAFDWKKEFKEIFDKGGFDIVIGNPPYLRIQGLHEGHEHTTKFIEKNFHSATGRYDFYVLFIEKGSTLLKKDGYLGFIVPHKFTAAQFGSGIRDFLKKNKLIDTFISFGHNFVFEDVTTYTGILILKNSIHDKFFFKEIGKLSSGSIESELSLIHRNDFSQISFDSLSEKPWSLQSDSHQGITKKINEAGPPITEHFDKVLQGVITGDDEIYFLSLTKDKGKTAMFHSLKANSEVELEKELLRPVLGGEDVKRFKEIKPKQYVIYPYVVESGKQRVLEESELKKKYPLVYDYLLKFKPYLIDLRKRFKTNPKFWYGLHRSRQLSWFEQEKVMTPEISLGCNMTLDNEGHVHNTQVYSFIRNTENKIDNKYFLAILNSKISWFYLKGSGNVLRGGYLRFKSKYLEPFCIPVPDKKVEKKLVDKMTDRLDRQKKFDDKYSKFINLVKINFKLDKIPSSINKFYQDSFEAMLTSLESETRVKIGIKDKSELMDIFESASKDLLKIKSEIFEIDDEVNGIVYKLYNLDESEIMEVEKNYPEVN